MRKKIEERGKNGGKKFLFWISKETKKSPWKMSQICTNFIGNFQLDIKVSQISRHNFLSLFFILNFLFYFWNFWFT